MNRVRPTGVPSAAASSSSAAAAGASADSARAGNREHSGVEARLSALGRKAIKPFQCTLAQLGAPIHAQSLKTPQKFEKALSSFAAGIETLARNASIAVHFIAHDAQSGKLRRSLRGDLTSVSRNLHVLHEGITLRWESVDGATSERWRTLGASMDRHMASVIHHLNYSAIESGMRRGTLPEEAEALNLVGGLAVTAAHFMEGRTASEVNTIFSELHSALQELRQREQENIASGKGPTLRAFLASNAMVAAPEMMKNVHDAASLLAGGCEQRAAAASAHEEKSEWLAARQWAKRVGNLFKDIVEPHRASPLLASPVVSRVAPHLSGKALAVLWSESPLGNYSPQRLASITPGHTQRLEAAIFSLSPGIEFPRVKKLMEVVAPADKVKFALASLPFVSPAEAVELLQALPLDISRGQFGRPLIACLGNDRQLISEAMEALALVHPLTRNALPDPLPADLQDPLARTLHQLPEQYSDIVHQYINDQDQALIHALPAILATDKTDQIKSWAATLASPSVRNFALAKIEIRQLIDSAQDIVEVSDRQQQDKLDSLRRKLAAAEKEFGFQPFSDDNARLAEMLARNWNALAGNRRRAWSLMKPAIRNGDQQQAIDMLLSFVRNVGNESSAATQKSIMREVRKFARSDLQAGIGFGHVAEVKELAIASLKTIRHLEASQLLSSRDAHGTVHKLLVDILPNLPLAERTEVYQAILDVHDDFKDSIPASAMRFRKGRFHKLPAIAGSGAFSGAMVAVPAVMAAGAGIGVAASGIGASFVAGAALPFAIRAALGYIRTPGTRTALLKAMEKDLTALGDIQTVQTQAQLNQFLPPWIPFWRDRFAAVPDLDEPGKLRLFALHLKQKEALLSNPALQENMPLQLYAEAVNSLMPDAEASRMLLPVLPGLLDKARGKPELARHIGNIWARAADLAGNEEQRAACTEALARLEADIREAAASSRSRWLNRLRPDPHG